MPDESNPKTGEVVSVVQKKTDEPTQSLTPVQTDNAQQIEVLGELTLQEAQRQMHLYQEYVKGLLDDNDYQEIQGKKAKKKSAWRKLAMAMNIKVTKVNERREELPSGDYAYHFDMEAQHPNGRVMPGTGSCTAFEKATLRDGKWMAEKKQFDQGRYVGSTWVDAIPNSIHNVRSTAETRATNRAISNLVAAGEVSAEEMDQGRTNDLYHKPEANNSQPSTPKPQSPVAGVGPDAMNCPDCNSKMYDNRYIADGGKGRYHKTKDTQPDWKCSNKQCAKGVWLEKYSRKPEPDYAGEENYY